MRSWVLVALLLIISLLAPSPANTAEKGDNLANSGNEFLRVCSFMENNDPTPSDYPHLMQGATCVAYVMGLGDGIVIESSYARARSGGKVSTPYCEADTYGMEQGQRVRILLKYIENHPEKAHLPTAGLYINAMGDAFPPCPDKK